MSLDKLVRLFPDKNWNWEELFQHLKWETILLFPEKGWYVDSISYNPNIDFDIILNNLQFEWNWDILSSHHMLTWEIVSSNMHLPWNWLQVSANSNVFTFDDEDWKLITKYKNLLNWTGISYNSNITCYHIKSHSEFPWNKYVVSYRFPELFEYFGIEIDIKYLISNPNITWYIIKSNPTYLKHFAFSENNWSELSSKPIITQEIIENNLQLPWDWKEIAGNPNIDFKFVEKYKDRDWNWDKLSRHKNILVKEILKSFHDGTIISWNWNMVLYNPSITIEDIIQEQNIFVKYWKKNYFSHISYIFQNNTFEQFETELLPLVNEHFKRWFNISKSIPITYELYQKYKYKLNYEQLAYNKKLSWKIIKKDPSNTYWNWYSLSFNRFGKKCIRNKKRKSWNKVLGCIFWYEHSFLKIN